MSFTYFPGASMPQVGDEELIHEIKYNTGFKVFGDDPVRLIKKGNQVSVYGCADNYNSAYSILCNVPPEFIPKRKQYSPFGNKGIGADCPYFTIAAGRNTMMISGHPTDTALFFNGSSYRVD